MSAQSTNRIGFNKGTKNQGIMQENSTHNVGSDGGCRKDSASDFDHDYIENARREFVLLTDSITEVVEYCKDSLYGMRCEIDHLDIRLSRIECLLRDQKRLMEKRNNSLNAIELLLAFISFACVVIGATLCFG